MLISATFRVSPDKDRLEVLSLLEVWNEYIEGAPIKSLYFDGRKDETVQQISGHRKLTSQAHVALIEEPGSKYIGHISLTAGESVKEIAHCVIKFTKTNTMSLLSQSVIGCDGTNVNTGWKGGVIRLLETYVGRPLQWKLCMLHTNELPLRHLILEMDGCTKGPYSYSGAIGLLLIDCEKTPVVKFDQIDCTLQPLDLKDIKKLSRDQQYLYRICLAMKYGSCSSSVTDNSPGKLSHARWLTTANRLLGLYIGTPSPSQNLKILVNYVMLVYAPMRKHIRELAVRRILADRNKKTKNSGGLRFSKLPKLNFEAADYIDLIDWPNCVVTKPPLTLHIKDKVLREMCKEQFPVLTFEEFSCHTQSVERCVKLISEAAMNVCGETARDGYIRAKLQARKELPTFNSKGQYYSNT
ncbi:hypothetical protein AVEN_76905-1 [Araneus ventricosus]|uniref:Uncharacterized protein n=1 Tax=Araneus ventricosus TaxID=182803 RepID=A0A4Y2RWS2_ARAVE|nr:hypothetical protein AVEN_76905-1 [Araneus ventricosus]